jgi:hypothetical protein
LIFNTINLHNMKKFILVFIIFQIYWLSMNAQWSGDPQVADTKVCTANANQHTSRTIPDGSGGVIVFWHDPRNGGSGDDIYYNKLNSAGNAVWSPASVGFALTSNGDGNYIDQVISDGSGGAFVSWETDEEVFVQHINSAGAKTWASNGISLSATGYSGFICSDGSGGVIVAWSDYRDDLDDGLPNAYAQRISSAGAKLWAAAGVLLENASGFSVSIGIIPDGSGGAIVPLFDTRNSNYDAVADEYDNLDIYAQRINASGSVVWAAAGVPVCTQNKNQNYEAYNLQPYIISDGSGGAVICWEDYRNDANNGNASPYNSDVFCQRINASGAAQWTANGIALCTSSGAQSSIVMMPDGTGGTVATWFDERNNFRVYAQKINGSGAVQWAANGIAVANETLSFEYDASPDATNSSMLVTWTSSGNVKAQKIDVADGTLAWGTGGTLVCGRSDSQSEPSITHNGGAGAIISWTDGRNGISGSDIYTNRVLANGTLPLALVTFDAQLIYKNVLLQWSTSSEQNTSHFDIERSTDGNNFSAIGKVNAAGNTSSAIKYSFPDNEPATGSNFYRLKMVDIDGHFSYSKTIVVRLENVTSLRIYPNPAKNTLYLHTSGNNENALIQVVDLAGKKVKEQKVILTRNTPIDISNLPKSIYKIIIKTETITEHMQFVKE